MSIVENRKVIELDLVESSSYPVFNFYQNDRNVIEFKLHKKRAYVDLTELDSVYLNFKRGESDVITRKLKVEGNTATYVMGAEEMASPGEASVNLQLFEGADRLTTIEIRLNIVEAFGAEHTVSDVESSETPDREEVPGEVGHTAPVVYLKKEEAERLYRKLADKITEEDLAEDVKSKLGSGSTPVTTQQEQEKVRVLKQADLSKHTSNTDTFTVGENGNVTTAASFTFTQDNVTAVFMPKGIDEMTLKFDKQQHWIGVGADEAMNSMALVGIGQQKIISHVSFSPFSLAVFRDYTQVDLDNTHTFTPGQEYKIVNSETDVKIYYKSGDAFKLWYRVLKEAVQLDNQTSMNWHSPRLGAAAGANDMDRTNQTLMTEVKLIEKTTASVTVDLSNYATKEFVTQAVAGGSTEKKYAVLVVAGQSNALGCDESPVDPIFKYGQHERVKQLGTHGANNLKVIPLGHCAENFQNMAVDNATNPANPTLKGPKGIHLPLAKLLLDKIPSDYEIVVIPAAYSATGFTVGADGTYNKEEMKPNEQTTLKWGAGSPYYLAIADRIEYLLSLNPANYFIGVVWCQGEADIADPAAHKTAFEAMTAAFFNHFNGGQYKNRVKKGTWDKSLWFTFETTKHWKAMQGAQTIWQNYQGWNPEGYVDLPDDTKVNTTTIISQDPATHFGQDAYVDVIAPAVLAKMVEAKVV